MTREGIDRVALGGYMAAIFGLSSMSQPPVPIAVSDVAYHLPEYLVLGLLVCRALGRRWRSQPMSTALLALGLTVGYGVLDELHQSFVPGRDASLHDVGSDVAGAALAVALFWIWARRRAVAEGERSR